MSARIIGAIFARGGSKGVPRKNIRSFAGRPLIAYAIEAARRVPGLERVVVSTDDPEIASVATLEGAEVPFLRPAELASDESPEVLSWRHLLDHFDRDGRSVDILVSVPATCPLRKPEDVSATLERLQSSGADLAITVCETSHNPYFTMVELDASGLARRAIRAPGDVWRRQMAPQVWGITAVAFAARAAYVRRTLDLYSGSVSAIVVPPERAIDIDTELDFAIAEFLHNRAHGRS